MGRNSARRIADDGKLQKFLRGLKEPPGLQDPGGADGDPQLSALRQYLQIRSDWSNGHTVVDFGCGRGVVPHEIDNLWPPVIEPPRYIAVDFDHVLDDLELSERIATRAERVGIEPFFRDWLPEKGKDIAAVVVRNVLHELDIAATARLLAALASHVTPEADVYIQDMNVVNPVERLNPAWDADLLVDVLKRLGFRTFPPVKQSSHAGTPWVVVIARSPRKAVTEAFAGAAVARARERQRQKACECLGKLQEPDEDTMFEYSALSFEIAAIDRQLQVWGYHEASTLSRAGIPIIEQDVGHLEELPSFARSSTGISAVISSKNKIDFPRLLASCREYAYFAGYSERSLFMYEPTLAELEDLVGRGCELRVLLCDPQSQAHGARSIAPVYGDGDRLRHDVEGSIARFGELRERVSSRFGEIAAARCRMRLSRHAPPCAFFFVDGRCFTSLYTLSHSGGSGPCIVYDRLPDPVGYYEILLQDFARAWEQGTIVGVEHEARGAGHA